MAYNILLITTDSQRTDSLACMGSSFACSPSLDALAEQGVLFTQAHSCSPVCMPARCSLMTGLHAPLHGCTENGLGRAADVPFFTDALKKLGYRTMMIGKTHFGPVPPSFDVQCLARGEKNADADDCFSVEMRRAGFSRSSSWPNNTPEEFCLDSLIVDKTIKEMERASKTGEPFFAFCSILSPHSPIDPPGRWAKDDLFRDKIPPPRFRKNEWEELPETIKKFCGIPNKKQYESDLTERLAEARGNIADTLKLEEIQYHNELYYRSAAYTDSLVGRLMAYLDAAGLREKTLVIFTSDHGIQNFDHGFNDKHNYYDESLRVPFIMSLPGVLPENEKRSFVSTVDIASTVLGAAGGEWEGGCGFDMFSPLAAGKPLRRSAAIAALYGSLALVTERWKLEYYYAENTFRLFDRLLDQRENINCADDGDHAEVLHILLKTLLAWRSGLEDMGRLKRSVEAGGPVARRVTSDVLSKPGYENEARLETNLLNNKGVLDGKT